DIVKTHPQHLILRTLFKPNPFPFPKAYFNQYTQGDYVDVIAELLAYKIQSFLVDPVSEETYLGTGRKTILDLARRTRPDVESNSVDDYNREIGVNLIPKDY